MHTVFWIMIKVIIVLYCYLLQIVDAYTTARPFVHKNFASIAITYSLQIYILDVYLLHGASANRFWSIDNFDG